MNEGIRLNRYLASCGLGARRKVEEIIFSGRVKVDGKVVLMPGYRITDENRVEVDGAEVLPERLVYLVMNKPAGYVCSVSDPYDAVITELLPEPFSSLRLFPVGRLDRESEGLLILTNDGELAQKILHPSGGVLREYKVLLDREIDRKAVRQWLRGIDLDGRILKPISVLITGDEPAGRWVSVVLAEGIKREIRRMARSLGFEVEVLIRKRIGKMELNKLPSGKIAEMSRRELWRAIRSGGTV
ncbi:MAG: pseudouridine synthase [Aminivibrio sp.]